MEPQQLGWLFLIIRFFVLLFDVVTFLFYFLLHKPWRKLFWEKVIRSKPETPSDRYSTYHRQNVSFTDQIMFASPTLAHQFQLAFKDNLPDRYILGHRRPSVAEIQASNQHNGTLLPGYRWLTYAQVNHKVTCLAKFFLKQNVKFQEPLFFYTDTCHESFLIAQALFQIGAIIATVKSAGLNLSGLLEVLKETKMRHVIITRAQLFQLHSIIHQIRSIRFVYVIDQPGFVEEFHKDEFAKELRLAGRHVKFFDMKAMLKAGKNYPNGPYSIRQPKPESVAVMLFNTSDEPCESHSLLQTHYNLTTAIHGFLKLFDSSIMVEDYPLIFYACKEFADTFEMILEIACFGLGIPIGFGRQKTMTDHLEGNCFMTGDLKLLRPTIIYSAHSMLTKMRIDLTETMVVPGFFGQLMTFIFKYKSDWTSMGYMTPLIDRIVCRKFQEPFGGRVKLVFTTGALLSKQTQNVVQVMLNLKVLNVYAMKETSGPCCITDLNDGSLEITSLLIGRIMRLADWNDSQNQLNETNLQGELVIGGPGVALGYSKQNSLFETLSFEYFDGSKWFKTGDIAKITPNGTVQIIDHKTNFILIGTGVKVPVGRIEAELAAFKYVNRLFVYGDMNHKYMIAFILPNWSTLHLLAAKSDIPIWSNESLTKSFTLHSAVMSEYYDFVKQNHLQVLMRPVKFVHLCAEEWTMDNGMLSSLDKINRVNLSRFYADTIKCIYRAAGQ